MRKRAMGGDFTIRKSNEVRVHHEKRSDRVTVDHERKIDWVKVHHKKKSEVVRVHHEKEGWGEKSPSERAMGSEFTMKKKSDG